MPTLKQLTSELNSHKSPERAKVLSWFFKTGKGQYGEGDVFLGLTVPLQRSIGKKYLELSLGDIKKLLENKIHEYRFTAMEILVMKYGKASPIEKKKIFNFYILNSTHANNWDLVDTSAPYIVGDYLLTKPRKILYKLAKSKNLWQKRISIVSTYAFIKQDDFFETLQISKMLLSDEHDLIRKAVGWMLREVGKRDPQVLHDFLKQYYSQISRTTLRYAIEKFTPQVRKQYLAGSLSTM